MSRAFLVDDRAPFLLSPHAPWVLSVPVGNRAGSEGLVVYLRGIERAHVRGSVLVTRALDVLATADWALVDTLLNLDTLNARRGDAVEVRDKEFDRVLFSGIVWDPVIETLPDGVTGRLDVSCTDDAQQLGGAKLTPAEGIAVSRASTFRDQVGLMLQGTSYTLGSTPSGARRMDGDFRNATVLSALRDARDSNGYVMLAPPTKLIDFVDTVTFVAAGITLGQDDVQHAEAHESDEEVRTRQVVFARPLESSHSYAGDGTRTVAVGGAGLMVAGQTAELSVESIIEVRRSGAVLARELWEFDQPTQTVVLAATESVVPSSEDLDIRHQARSVHTVETGSAPFVTDVQQRDDATLATGDAVAQALLDAFGESVVRVNVEIVPTARVHLEAGQTVQLTASLAAQAKVPNPQPTDRYLIEEVQIADDEGPQFPSYSGVLRRSRWTSLVRSFWRRSGMAQAG